MPKPPNTGLWVCLDPSISEKPNLEELETFRVESADRLAEVSEGGS